MPLPFLPDLADFDFVTYFRQRLKDEKSTATQAASQASCNASPNLFPSSLAASFTGGVPLGFSETAWRQPEGYAQANSQFLYSAQPQQQEQQHQQLQAPIPMSVHALGSHSNEFSQDSLAHTCTGVAMLPEISGSLGWATQTSLLLPHDTQRVQWTAPQHIADGTAISTSLPASNPLQRTSASMGTSSCTVPTLGNPHHHVPMTGNSTQAEGSPASGAAQYQASLTSTTLNLDLSISPATSVGTGKATLCPPASLPLSSRPSQQPLLHNTTHLQFPSSPSSMAQVSELGSMCNEPSRDCQDLLAIEPMTGLQLGNIWPSDVMPNHPTGGKDWDMTSFYPASQRSASHAHYSSVQASFATSPLASSVFSDSSEELASTCFSMISPNNNSVFDEPTKLPPPALGSQVSFRSPELLVLYAGSKSLFYYMYAVVLLVRISSSSGSMVTRPYSLLALVSHICRKGETPLVCDITRRTSTTVQSDTPDLNASTSKHPPMQ